MPAATDAIIVGAGPVGLVAALRLSRMGHAVVVCEAEPDITEELRASTFHPPTLDMLDTLELARPLIARGLVSPTWQVRIHETGEKAEFDLSILRHDTGFPFRLQAEQWKLSRLLLLELGRLGVPVRFGHRVEAVTQDQDCVSVSGDGFSLRARYGIGCDGARSIVRAAMHRTFQGETYPETTILATTGFAFHEAMPGLANVNYVWTERPEFSGTFSLLRVPGRWRASLHTAPEEDVEAALSPAAIEAKLQAICPREGRYDVHDVRPYRIHQRIVDDYRAGRLLLAGDAAHLNSPSGGMGMNGGIHDAFELSDALDQVLRGADAALLDRYTRRRRPIAEREILAQADRNRARMRERDPARRRAMLADLQATAADPVACRTHLLRTSMITGLQAAAAIT